MSPSWHVLCALHASHSRLHGQPSFPPRSHLSKRHIQSTAKLHELLLERQLALYSSLHPSEHLVDQGSLTKDRGVDVCRSAVR